MSYWNRQKRLATEREEVNVLTGTTDIDISEAVYTGMIDILTIVPATGESLRDLMIDLDFDKATTGVNEVATNNDTLNCALYIAVDGTNYCGVEAMTQKTLTGTAGIEGGGHRFKVGLLDSTSKVKVKVKLSAERADAEIPYRITYLGRKAPTVTAVAAA